MMFFIRKKEVAEPTPLCFHSWKLADVGVDETTDCVDLYFDDYYVVGCVKCSAMRKLNDVEYSRLKRSGLLKETEG